VTRTRVLIASSIAVTTVAISASVALAAFNVGPVVATAKIGSFKGPWYVWNAKTCTFQTTKKHPKTYVPKVRKIPNFTLVYLPEATGNPFDDSLNAATRAAAVKGVKFYQFSNEYPSTTAPLRNVDQAHTVKASSVIEANVVPTQYPAIQAAFKKYCIPWLNEYNVPGSKNIPVFQTDNRLTGVDMAKAAVRMMKSRGWDPKQTWIVTCADPNVGTNRGGVYDIDRGYRETVKKLFRGSRISRPDLTCDFSKGLDGARATMANWITSHPDAKYVTAVSHIDSVYSLGMANALRDAHYGNRAIVAGRGGDAGYIKRIRSGDPIVAVNGDPQFKKWGVPIVGMAQDLALGNPVPALVSPAVRTVTKANAGK
jgi:ABC-type sugar transport system substrate-binding protein